MKLMRTIFVLSFVLVFQFSCSNSPTSPSAPEGSIDLSVDLQIATPASQGVDASKLTAAFDHAEHVEGLLGLVVVRNSLLIAEAYYGDNDLDYPNHVRSVTKSVISMLIGIAIEEGFIKNVDESIDVYLNDAVDNIPEDKKVITIEHLLTMTGGFQWFESGGTGYNEWILSSDHIDYVLDKPLSDQPGQRFNYNSAAVHLLSVILSEATGMRTLDFAKKYLFEPLNIQHVRWDINNRGYYNGGAGLQLSGRDMAKLGILFLQDGFSGNKQLVHPAWVLVSTEQHQQMGYSYGALKSVHYGYLWWLNKDSPYNAFLAWGYGGQFIYCIPDLNLVVVTSAEWRGISGRVEQQVQAILDLIVNHVVPVVQ